MLTRVATALKTRPLPGALGRRLGLLVLGEREVRYAVRSPGNGCGPVERFAWPDGATWDAPDELGRAFREHLRGRGVRAGAADVVLAPPGWTVLRTTAFPAGSQPDLLGGMVELAAEEAFAGRLDELAYSYQAAGTPSETEAAAGTPSAAGSSERLEVSIFACPRANLDRIEAFCQSAGLRPGRVVPLPAAAAWPPAPNGAPPADGAAPVGEQLLSLNFDGRAVLLLARGRRCVWQRVIEPKGDPSADLRRAALAVPTGESTPLAVVGDGERGDQVRDGAPRDAFGGRAGPKVSTDEFLSALAAAVPAADDDAADLLRVERSQRRRPLPRGVRLALPAAAGVAILLAVFVGSWLLARGRIARANERLEQLRPQTERLERMRDLDKAVAPWFRPGAHLGALAALAEQFPPEGSIWLTGLEIDRDGRMTLTGRARRRSDLQALRGRLETDAAFAEVGSIYDRQETGREPLIAFAIECTYVAGGSSPPAGPARAGRGER